MTILSALIQTYVEWRRSRGTESDLPRGNDAARSGR
jgi:hypothetical protein